MRPLDKNSSRLLVKVDEPADGIKDELQRVSLEDGTPPSELAREVLLYCRGKYSFIHERMKAIAAAQATTQKKKPATRRKRA